MEEKSYKFIEPGSIKFSEMRKFADLGYNVNELKECLKSEGVDLSISEVVRVIEAVLRDSGLAFTEDKEFGYLNCTLSYISIDSPFEVIEESNTEEQTKLLHRLTEYYIDLAQHCGDEPFNVETIIANIGIIYKEVCIFINDLFEYIYTNYHDDLNENKYNHLTHHYFMFADDSNEGHGDYFIEIDMFVDAVIEKPVMHIVGTCFSGEVPNSSPVLILDSFNDEDKNKLMAKYYNTVELGADSVEPEHVEAEIIPKE
jgi:hypothetical protein